MQFSLITIALGLTALTSAHRVKPSLPTKVPATFSLPATNTASVNVPDGASQYPAATHSGLSGFARYTRPGHGARPGYGAGPGHGAGSGHGGGPNHSGGSGHGGGPTPTTTCSAGAHHSATHRARATLHAARRVFVEARQ